MRILKRLRAWLGFEDQEAQIEALVSALEVQGRIITNFSLAVRRANEQTEEFYADAYWHMPQELVDKWKARLGTPHLVGPGGLKYMTPKAWDQWIEEFCNPTKEDPNETHHA